MNKTQTYLKFKWKNMVPAAFFGNLSPAIKIPKLI